jgi:outer membrane protein assembly factor BamA
VAALAKWSYTIVVILIIGLPCTAQFLTITDITLEGNKRTKEYILLRELEFKTGDRLKQSQLTSILTKNELLLLSTGLFVHVKLNVSHWDVENQEIKLHIIVEEAPSLIPIPIFELADRNFNVWWNDFNASLKRVNYGIKLAILNAWGYGGRIKLSAQFGYTPKFDFSALLPYLDNKQSLRMELGALYAQNKEVSLYNIENKQFFDRLEERVIFKRQRYRVGLIFRRKIFAKHILRIGYSNNWIDPELTAQEIPNGNQDFFLNSTSRQRYMFAEYEFTYDRRDLRILPTRGWLASIRILKDGFGIFDDISATYLVPAIKYYHPISKKFIASVELNAKIGLERDRQPYYNYQGFGYGNDYLRGYELFVVDALDYFYGKFSIAYKAVHTAVKWPKIVPKGMRIMPVQIYIAANYDTGFANDPFYSAGNSFTNRWLRGGGLGLNLLLYNTLQIQIEWSVNHLGESGLFLHSNTAF